MTESLLQVSQKVGLTIVGAQKVRVYKMPTIPANLLQKELWAVEGPGVCHLPISLNVKLEPSIIQAAAPAVSLKEPSLTT